MLPSSTTEDLVMTASGLNRLESILGRKKHEDIKATHFVVASREAREKLGRIVENARSEQNQFVITEHGTPAAAVVPIEDLKILDWLKRQNIKDAISEAVIHDMSIEEFKELLTGGDWNDNKEDRI